MSPTAAHQLGILERMGVARSDELAECDVAIDAVIGYSLRGAPTGQSARLIERVNLAPIVVALDTPSGVNVNTGNAPGVAVVADATMTLALPKIGLRHAPQVGALYLADISVPRSVTVRWGREPDFTAGSILRVVP
jgi:NAD(P)H-hydrate epimerase